MSKREEEERTTREALLKAQQNHAATVKAADLDGRIAAAKEALNKVDGQDRHHAGGSKVRQHGQGDLSAQVLAAAPGTLDRGLLSRRSYGCLRGLDDFRRRFREREGVALLAQAIERGLPARSNSIANVADAARRRSEPDRHAVARRLRHQHRARQRREIAHVPLMPAPRRNFFRV